MTVQVVVPYLSMLWCLEDMLASFGKSEIPILIIDNSPSSDTKHAAFEFQPNVEIEHYPENIGIAASWNRGLKRGADQTLIVSQMVRFAPADLARLPEKWGLDFVIENMRKYVNPYGMTFGDQGFHLIAVGKKTVEKIGYFDENFLAYGEDDDYTHRMTLAKIGMGGWDNNWLGGKWDTNWLDAGIFSIAYGVQNRAGKIDTGRAGRMVDYYKHKWCSAEASYPGDYQTPFNNPDNELSYWPTVKHQAGELTGACT